MSKLAADLYFELDGLTCTREILGESVTVERAHILYRIDIPDRSDAFSFTFASPVGPEDPRDYKPTVALIETSTDLVEVRLVRVVANLEVADPWDRDDVEAGEDSILTQIITDATTLVTDLCNWTRIVQQQDWMTPPARRPELVSAARLIDVSDETTAALLPTMILPGGAIRIIPPDGILDRTGLAAVTEAIKARGSPTAEELFLADARHLCMWSQAPSSADMAILQAAIAVEVRTKRTLRELATDAQAPLVGLLLDNPRDWSLSAHGYFAKAVEVVVDDDLGEQWQETAKGVQQLFEARNAIAHRGQQFGLEVARNHVETASTAFRLLDSLGGAS